MTYVVSAFRRTVVVALFAAVTHAQGLEFEVATIKPNNTGSTRSGTSMPPRGRFEGTNVTLHQLVVTAYGVRDFQVVGGPDWLKDDRFDVIGKPADTTPPNASRDMLRNLLAQRFKLVIHKETREQPVYELVFARVERKLGPALKAVDCSASSCGNTNTSESSGSGTVKATGLTMEDLARWASNRVDRIVIDRTDLVGTYDFELKYTSARVGGAVAADTAPSLFTALQEQLGLKLEGARAPVEFVVIDRAERPTPD